MGPNSGQIMPIQAVRRARWWYIFLLLVISVFLVRLFYLQIIRYNYYHQTALHDQLKEYEIAPERGVISAHQGDKTIPIVLNEKLFTIYVDPSLVKEEDRQEVANTVVAAVGGNADEYVKKMHTPHSRYQILAKRVSVQKKDSILKHKFPGVGAQQQHYRTYPQGDLAAQVLGFVNNDNKGVYGIEQALNKELAGVPGQLKAVTDANGVPLAANTGNILTQPTQGQDLTLTLDVGMQKQLQQILAQGVQKVKAKGGSALIMDTQTGAIRAMANFPTYNPADYGNVSDGSLFNNNAVSMPLEIGSTMKPLTAAAALNSGAVPANITYYDPASWTIDGFKITNIEEDGGPGTKNLTQLLDLSLNTGATWLLMQMSQPGGTQINQKGRETWHDYMVNHYRFGKPTGIEQGYEAEGTVPDPNDGYARNLTYANTAFGQAMTATPLQLAAALNAAVNGGTFYQPYLVDRLKQPDGTVRTTQPKVVRTNVVSPQVSTVLQGFMEQVVVGHGMRFPAQYSVGGKTGTAQIAKPGGGYYDNEFNGTYVGFVGGDKPQYVIAISVIQPQGVKYAGSGAAQPIFASLVSMLINNFTITPRS